MAAYSFDFLGRDGAIHAFDVGEFASDIDAARYGRDALLTTLTAVLVEIWADESRVARIARGSLAAPVQSGGANRLHRLG
jgi:hypothetical protein